MGPSAVAAVRQRINGGGMHVPDGVGPNIQHIPRSVYHWSLTGIAGNPFPVYFFIMAPSGPFDVP
jgi:hypothetical protein